MNETAGAVTSAIAPDVVQLVFGDCANAINDGELEYMTRVDRAHVIMLEEAGLIGTRSAVTLLTEIEALRRSKFAALRDRTAPRGIYLLYEGYLIERIGEQVGGLLHLARSRNDLSATCLKLRVREKLATLVIELWKLQSTLLGVAGRYADVVMPVYTHGQVAQPGTYGHYLTGVARGLERDLGALTDGLRAELGECPLGAGAATGTSFPIKPERTAELLGFLAPVRHSIDAVATRDVVLRLLSMTAILGVTLSRLSADLRLWLTREFDFLSLPDSLVGSSSMMPQKRNPFLLEHIEGMAARPLGGFVSAATSCHAKAYTNCISVGTEAVAVVWESLRSITTAVTLMRKVVAGATPSPQRMLERAESGMACATEAANVLVRTGRWSFRSAHRAVGLAVIRALRAGGGDLHRRVLEDVFPTECRVRDELTPETVARETEYGGGPGQRATGAGIRTTWESRRAMRRRFFEDMRRWRHAESLLDRASGALCARVEGGYAVERGRA